MPALEPCAEMAAAHSKVGDHLSFFLHEWESVDASLTVLKIVWGLNLEFMELSLLTHSHSACDSVGRVGKNKYPLLSEAILVLIQKKATEHAPPSIGFYACIFLVLKNN